MARSITDFIIRLKVEGQGLVDKLKDSVEDVDSAVKKAKTSSDKLEGSLKGLGGTLRSNISTGNNFADSILDSVAGMGRYANAIALATTAVVALGTRAVLLADQIQDVANSTGIAAGALLNFRNSIVEAGGEANDFETLATRLNTKIGEAADGSEKARQAFRNLGVNLGDANGNLRNTGDILRDVIRALQQIPDPALRSAAAVDAIDKSAGKIDWQNVQAFNDQFKDDQIAQLSKYKGAIDELSNAISTKLVTAFGSVAVEINKITDVIKKNEEDANKLGKTYNNLPGTKFLSSIGVAGGISKETLDALNAYFKIFATDIPIAELKLQDLSKAIQHVQKQGLFPSEKTGELSFKPTLDELFTIGNELYKQEQERKKLLDKENEIVEASHQQGLSLFKNNLALEDQQRNAERLRNLFYDIALINETIYSKTELDRLAKQNELIGLYGDELRLKAGLLDIENERQNQINDIMASLRFMGEEATAEDVWRAQQAIQLAQYVANEKTKILKEGLEKEKALSLNITSGIQAALVQLAQSMNPAVVAFDATIQTFNTMASALDTFVREGKFKFKDFARSILLDISLMIAKMYMFQAVSSALGAFGITLPGIPGKASGGPVKGNQPYVVGEKGPELFVPKSAGTIIPNNKMNQGQGVGGPVTNVYNNYSISAIDSQSVAQFFAQNRKIALGAVTMAQKELPYGVG